MEFIKKLCMALSLITLPSIHAMQSRIAQGIYRIAKGINIGLPIATTAYGIYDYQQNSGQLIVDDLEHALYELKLKRSFAVRHYPALMNLHDTVMDELHIPRIPTDIGGGTQGQGPSLQGHIIRLTLPDAHILNAKIQQQPSKANQDIINSHKVKLRHEIGHSVHDDEFNINVTTPLLGCLSLQAVSTAYNKYASKPVPQTIGRALIRAPKLLVGGATKYLVANHLLPFLYRRHAEGSADAFAFKNTKNSEELIANAQECERIDSDNMRVLTVDVHDEQKLIDFLKNDVTTMHDFVKNKEMLRALLAVNENLRKVHSYTNSQLAFPLFVQRHKRVINSLIFPDHPLLTDRAANARAAAEKLAKNPQGT